MNLIDEFFRKSEILRAGYINSLCIAIPNVKAIFMEKFENIPEMFLDLYSFSNGTNRNIKEQKFFDFIPGYRLMQIEEVIEMSEKLSSSNYTIIPFLNDYSGCFYAYAKIENQEYIVSITEEGIEIIHNSVNDFWKTINAFYDEKVYFLDEDGYLSYDFDKEGIIGKMYNSQVNYWG